MIDQDVDNLRLAYERTTLAWTRTALALIGFGFAIDKFFTGLEGTTKARTPRIEGVTMICFGLLALALGVYERRQFKKLYPDTPRSLAGFVSIMTAILGIMALIAAFTR